ncbi:hypothetical protein JCM12296A_55940 [Desulfosarcina cetonica]|uniref:hypothetical protein n=1 Tax=Desulfosarcina cetonica TaxID=90730 RepID=UPI0006D0C41B|nr:hypothetical protein [Desulfosarcina cetonica]
MKRIVILILLIMLSVAPPAKAGGIPTFDIANTIAMALDYITQIMKYQEQISQTSSEAAQYAQMLKDYMQTLKEYQNYLNQLESLKNKISSGDWKFLLKTLSSYVGAAELWSLIELNPDSATFEDYMDAVLGIYGYVPKDLSEVEAAAKELGIWTDQYEEKANQIWNQYELFKDKYRINAQVNEESRERINKVIPQHAQILDALGDESDLATLQAMAYQNQTIMKQLESLIQVQNAVLYNMESQQATRAAQSARWMEKERERLASRETYQASGKTRLIDF